MTASASVARRGPSTSSTADPLLDASLGAGDHLEVSSTLSPSARPRAVALAFSLSSAACSASSREAPAYVHADVSAMPLTVVLESPKGTEAKPAWSCAAYCLTKYHCRSDGDSESTANLVTSEGDSAASAFQKLAGQCTAAHADLIAHGRCHDGSMEAEGATIESSCARN